MIAYSGYDELIAKVYAHNQEHVFAYWDDLSDENRLALLKDLADVDFSLMENLFAGRDSAAAVEEFSPAEYIPYPAGEAASPELAAQWKAAEKAGDAVIRQGKVAAFIVAGGQGSRLGFDGPKGMFPTASVSGKTLFQLHGEKLLKTSMKYGVAVPWLIMTSQLNHETTAAYFAKMKNFGLDERDVFIFPQNMIPSLDANGKLLLASPHSLFRNPDGHGGSLAALKTSGVLEEMRRRGIELISYFQVDNPLIKIIDPAFIGFHTLRGAQASSKAIKKVSANEKVGVFVRFIGGAVGVVEYSDLPASKAEEHTATGELAYCMGSTAIHIFNLDFIDELTQMDKLSLPYHTARKKIAVFVGCGTEDVSGLKFEKFVFDALPLAKKSIVLETLREEEFAPVKNATGADSLATCQELMNNLYRRWLAERGVDVPRQTQYVEISPLTAIEASDIPSDIVVPPEEKVLL